MQSAGRPVNMELKIKSKPIDFELCELLGDKPSDFLVLCFDGVQLDFFGTPYDSPQARVERRGLVDLLNDKSEKSLWPKMWENWKPQICHQFKLPPNTTSAKYRPVVTCEISRVCHGYSEHLHAAIGLFDTLADKITSWGVRRLANGKSDVEIVAKNAVRYSMTGKSMALVIAKCVLALLKDQPKR